MHVRTLCLGALALGDATGYEIKKMFEDGEFSHFLEASYGSIYPSLTRLAEDGLVTCQAEAQDRRPDKKVYSITPRGRAALIDALTAPIAEDKFRSEFLFVMLFAHLLPSAAVSGLIDAKIAEYLGDLENLDENVNAVDTPGGEFVREFGRTVLWSMADFLRKKRHLIEGRGSAQEKTGARADLVTPHAENARHDL